MDWQIFFTVFGAVWAIFSLISATISICDCINTKEGVGTSVFLMCMFAVMGPIAVGIALADIHTASG